MWFSCSQSKVHMLKPVLLEASIYRSAIRRSKLTSQSRSVTHSWDIHARRGLIDYAVRGATVKVWEPWLTPSWKPGSPSFSNQPQ